MKMQTAMRAIVVGSVLLSLINLGFAYWLLSTSNIAGIVNLAVAIFTGFSGVRLAAYWKG